jgi:hypothetical protein
MVHWHPPIETAPTPLSDKIFKRSVTLKKPKRLFIPRSVFSYRSTLVGRKQVSKLLHSLITSASVIMTLVSLITFL